MQANRRMRKRVKSLRQEKAREMDLDRTQQQNDYDKKRLEQNSDLHPSIRSSQDFWQEIEPKMNLNAEMLDFSGTNPEKEEMPQLEDDDFEQSADKIPQSPMPGVHHLTKTHSISR